MTLVDEDRALHAMFVTRKKEQYLVTLYDGKTSILQQMYKQLYSGGAIGGPNAGCKFKKGAVTSVREHCLLLDLLLSCNRVIRQSSYDRRDPSELCHGVVPHYCEKGFSQLHPRRSLG